MAGAAERARHWADFSERGAAWGPGLLAFIYQTLGRTACFAVMAPVMVYFYIAGAKQRRASLEYLARVWRTQGRPGKPGHWHAFRHFWSFGEAIVDKFEAWIGRLPRASVEAIDGGVFDEMRTDPRGAIIISAHFGAVEIIRAIASRDQRRRVNVVIHTKHARSYNDMLARFAPKSKVALLEASEFDVSMAAHLSAAVERGEWVVIMGDRMPLTKGGRTVAVDFLGEPAHFPQGPFVLAAALRCPVYLMFCFKQAGKHRVHFSLWADCVRLDRRNRKAELAGLVERFARPLEKVVLTAPYQWFNFYDFWATPAGGEGRGA